MSDNPDDGIVLTEEQKRRRRARSIAIALSLGVLVALFYVVTLISSYNYRIIELLIVASIWYLVCTSVLTVGQYYLERYFARGAARELPPTPLQRFRHALFQHHAPLPVAVEGDASISIQRPHG